MAQTILAASSRVTISTFRFIPASDLSFRYEGRLDRAMADEFIRRLRQQVCMQRFLEMGPLAEARAQNFRPRSATSEKCADLFVPFALFVAQPWLIRATPFYLMKMVSLILGALLIGAASLSAVDAVGPQSKPNDYPLTADSLPQPGVPQGRLEGPLEFHRRIFAGTVRRYWIFVPAQYRAEKSAAVCVFQDGQRALIPGGGGGTQRAAGVGKPDP